jgi:hypothetical protein
MQHLLCNDCGDGRKAGTTTDGGWPPETSRVAWGVAKLPQREQRVLAVNGEVYPLAPGFYNCDLCNAPIMPGDRCCAVTVWRGDRPAIGLWEDEYLKEEA